MYIENGDGADVRVYRNVVLVQGTPVRQAWLDLPPGTGEVFGYLGATAEDGVIELHDPESVLIEAVGDRMCVTAFCPF
jgi:hypothetical protein